MDLTRLTGQVGRIKIKNVADMPLFYALFILVLALMSSIYGKYEWVTIVLFVFSGSLIMIAIFGYLYFVFKNPDYLRSEEYHLKKQSLEILGDKDNLLPVDASNIVEINNPYQLSDGNKESE